MTITWKGSPNYDTNRKPIDRVVIHWFGMGTLEGAHSMFQKAGGTSAHYGISDSRVWQWVKEEHVAYHAGNYAMNQRSIGIEHDANPDKQLSETSYKTSAKLIADICKRYKIEPNRQNIIKHSEVKATACPGSIDLDKLIALVKGNMSDEYGNMVWKSTQHDGTVKYLYGDKNPREVPSEEIVNHIGGLRSRITTLDKELGTLKAEVENREEQTSRLKVQVSEAEIEIKDLRIKLSEKIGECEELAVAKGKQYIELKQALSTIESLKEAQCNGEVTLTIRDIFTLIWNQKITIKK
jgi:hypothetical protein